MPDDTSEAAPVVVTGAAAHVDHPGDVCTYSWCTAHRDTGECDCPYASVSPHRAENCRYHHTDDDTAGRHGA